MDNIIISKNHEYKQEKIWRKNRSDQTRDSKGQKYPYPIEGQKWSGKQLVIDRLSVIHDFLNYREKYEKYDKGIDCLLCDAKQVVTKKFIYKNTMWEDGLLHYIDVHNIDVSLEFKKFIFDSEMFDDIENIEDINRSKKSEKHKNNKMILDKLKKNNKEYVILDRNQLLILDALMIHGGYVKKYIDTDKDISRYSEHAGLLDFEKNSLSKIVVSGKTYRVDKGDDEIYLPMGMDEMLEYEYIFHTHPPTPKPGGRAIDGILYEVPSIGDIYHFIDHHNDGNVIGSLVVSAEGLYNIRKVGSSTTNIRVDEDALYVKYQKIFNKIQNEAISEYGVDFDTHTFYSKIAQNTQYIDKMNNVLNEFDIQIDYYPRKKDKSGKWFLDTVFLVFRQNK